MGFLCLLNTSDIKLHQRFLNYISSEFSVLFIKFLEACWRKAVHKSYINKINEHNPVLLEEFLQCFVCVRARERERRQKERRGEEISH